MGKKIFSLLEKMKPQFIKGCAERNHDPEIAEKVWKDWEALLRTLLINLILHVIL